MTLPTTPEEWLNWLAIRHDAERGELEALDAHYELRAPLCYMHPEILREVEERIQQVVIAWPQLVVDTVDERLDVEGFRLPDEDADDADLWRVWQENDLDEESQLAHVDAMVMRRSYITVGTNEEDSDTPLVTVDSPLEVFASVDPRTRKVRAALRRWCDEDSLVRIVQQYATLYLPDATISYEAGDGGWKETGRDEHKLGQAPVVPLINRSRLADRCGRSELTPVLPLSTAANKIATDMMVAAEFVAIPLRGMWGTSPDAFEDQDGNKLTALQAILGRMLTIPETDGREFEFPAASLSNFHDTINQLAKLVASIAGLPPDYMGLATDNPPSAESRLAGEVRLIKRAERKQRAFGGSWESMARLVRRFQTGEWDPRFKRMETIWRDASTPTTAQKADAAVKLHAAEIVPRRQTQRDLGYTDTQIRNMQREFDEQAAADPVGQVTRALGQIPPAPEPQAPQPAA